MKHSTITRQKGIGLIEVLIATVVVAVGLLAVASLQGTFMSSSGGSKTRAEAQVLAEQKLEALRNNVTSTGYRDLNADGVADAATITATDNPVGTNTSFTRTWTITNVAPPVPPFTATDPKLRKISVQVGWDANGDGTITPPDETVNVVTEMAWIDPAKATEYAAANAGGSTSVASPRQNASEDAASENVIGTNLEIIDLVPATTGSAGIDSTVAVTLPASAGGATITLTQVAVNSHYYTATHSVLSSIAEGVIAVFLCGDANTCTHIQNHFGGVPHRIAGTVHTTSSKGFTDIKVAWTSSSVSDCYNGQETVVSGSGNNQYRYKPYECIYAGNCDATADNVNGCTYGVTDAQIAARHVGPGGEYGDVGLIGVDDQGGDREQVCFLEDTVDSATSPLLTPSGNTVLNENYLFSVTKRFYAARRIKHNGSINDQKSEGINRSYTNHNFLVVSRGTGNSANQVCNLKAVARSVALAPREIIQPLDESTSNSSLADAVYTGTAGTAKTFTGIVNGNATNLKLIIPDTGNCYLNNNNGSTLNAYACAVPTGTTSAVIKGGSNERPTLNPAVFATCTKTDAAPCTWVDNFTASATPSTDCTTFWGATVTNGHSVTAYLNATEPFGGSCSSETRTCTAGTLSGTYTNQACSVAAGAGCTVAPWGAIANGGSVTAYSSAAVPPGVDCATVAQTRTCTNGILSGSNAFASCVTQTTRTVTVTATSSGTGTVSGVTVSGTGATCVGMVCTVDNAWTGTLTATGTCSGGGSVTGSTTVSLTTATTATISLGNCTGPVCTTPWNTTVASGGSTTAYQSSSVVSPSTCTSELRFCNDGVLSGTYTHQSCTANCTWAGGTVNDGSTVTAYQSATPAGACVNESRACTNGTLSGSYTNTSCTAGCTINGTGVISGASVTAYQSALPTGACVSQSRTCTSGVASGSYTNTSCLAGCTVGGTSVASGSSITDYTSSTVNYPSTCTTQSALCTNGTISGFATCARVCTVPLINGMSTTNAANITAVATAITNAGFTVGTRTDTGNGTPHSVSLQNPASGTTSAACGSAISYSYH
ncbi:MAG: type IV pilus modification protein PilV [Candidatus Saccharimonadales bacterium]